MKNTSIKCLQCYSFDRTYLFVAQSVKAILPLTDYESKTSYPWHLGHIQWDGFDVPVVHVTMKEKPAMALPHSHLMIVQCLSEHEHAYVAMVIAQIARPIEVEQDSLQFEGSPMEHLYPVKGPQMMGQIVDIQAFSDQLKEKGLIE